MLEDYDLRKASMLVQGVDVWLNNPRRPYEACGTSGMKVLPNGGLNVSVLDGWWAEAYRPGVGWAIGDGEEFVQVNWFGKIVDSAVAHGDDGIADIGMGGDQEDGQGAANLAGARRLR